MSDVTILETIDNAIADCELSTDAMRWTPETATAQSAPSREQIEATWNAHCRAMMDGLNAAFAQLGEQWKAIQQAQQVRWPARQLDTSTNTEQHVK